MNVAFRDRGDRHECLSYAVRIISALAPAARAAASRAMGARYGEHGTLLRGGLSMAARFSVALTRFPAEPGESVGIPLAAQRPPLYNRTIGGRRS